MYLPQEFLLSTNGTIKAKFAWGASTEVNKNSPHIHMQKAKLYFYITIIC